MPAANIKYKLAVESNNFKGCTFNKKNKQGREAGGTENPANSYSCRYQPYQKRLKWK